MLRIGLPLAQRAKFGRVALRGSGRDTGWKFLSRLDRRGSSKGCTNNHLGTQSSQDQGVTQQHGHADQGAVHGGRGYLRTSMLGRALPESDGEVGDAMKAMHYPAFEACIIGTTRECSACI